MTVRSFHEAAQPVNEGEVEVLRCLRDSLDASWYVIGNFEFPAAGGRWYECDALALHESGYGYLVETKAWTGAIHGNDKSWILPSLDGRGRSSRQPPIHVLTMKLKKLVSHLGQAQPLAKSFRLDPLVVLVSDVPPVLSGKSQETTVLLDDLTRRLGADPRTEAQRASANVGEGAAGAIFEHLREATRAPTTNIVGEFQLGERLELRPDGVETWTAQPAADPTLECILKRYPIDLLAPPEKRDEQLRLARRHHTVLDELDESDVVPLWGAPFEVDGDFVVVSRRPRGSSLRSLIDTDQIDTGAADRLVLEMFRVLARIHFRNVVHRWIRPFSLWISDDWRVRYSDFDLARLADEPGVTRIVEPDQFDLEYAAPEVVQDLALATARSDVYSLGVIAREIYGGSLAGADPTIGRVLGSCLESQPADRPADAGEAHRAMVERDLDLGLFAPQDVIDNRYMVRSRHETGGLTVVYRLFDNMLRREFGAKFVRAEYQHLLNAAEEWHVLEDVPAHSNISKPTFVLQMNRLRRGQTDFTLKATFLLTPWIEGRPLDHYIDRGLPWRRVLEVGRDMAKGLSHLHAHEVLHRDIKPENVLIREDLSAVILDFNVSTPEDISTKTSLGTAAYRAPEIPSAGWSKAADLYSLGVCMVELLAKSRLGGQSAREWLDGEGALWDEARTLLLRLLDEDPRVRGTADEVAEELERLAEAVPASRADVEDPPQLEHHRGANPYVERLMSYFSQSIVSNAGTRGLDRFAEWLYVDTAIDRTLRPQVVAGDKSLVVITGNAGDGKTAFIRGVERDLVDRGAERIPARAKNGSELRLDGHLWRTNWDGSQDEGEVDNQIVLREFLEDFAGEELAATPGRTSVIAINEGRLVDFLHSEQEVGRFRSLARIVDDAFAGHRDPPEWMTVVNLNKRVLTRSADGHDVVASLLTKMSDERLWELCAACPAVGHCPNYSNAEMMRDPVLGPRGKERIREVLDVVRLRRRLHITTRDLLSALAYTIVGNTRCVDFVEADEETRARFELLGQTYNRLFAASATFGVGRAGDGADEDRLLREVGELDVADSPHPELDGRLWLVGTDALGPASEGLPARDRQILAELRDGSPSDRLIAHRALRRKLFLEREEPDYIDLLPYQSLRRFQGSLVEVPQGLNEELAAGISASEGLRRGVPEVAVRLVSDVDSLDRSFVCRQVEDFALVVVDESASVAFVEYAPDLLRLTSKEDASLALDIDVDIFEALMRMNRGFTPSREDLRGSWLSLATFKERLASMPSRELLLLSRAGELTRIQVGAHGSVVAEALA